MKLNASSLIFHNYEWNIAVLFQDHLKYYGHVDILPVVETLIFRSINQAWHVEGVSFSKLSEIRQASFWKLLSCQSWIGEKNGSAGTREEILRVHKWKRLLKMGKNQFAYFGHVTNTFFSSLLHTDYIEKCHKKCCFGYDDLEMFFLLLLFSRKKMVCLICKEWVICQRGGKITNSLQKNCFSFFASRFFSLEDEDLSVLML